MDKLILLELEKTNDLLTIIPMLVGFLVFAKIDQEKSSELIQYLNGRLLSYPNNATAI